ncbi:MAG TPA: alpha/beta hydrolase domain-containing protein [Steroidobacteraceae bacterium]|nr:alpha/beta hydrolase domain-containing protein [Steroidobacteraceae bacterium]
MSVRRFWLAAAACCAAAAAAGVAEAGAAAAGVADAGAAARPLPQVSGPVPADAQSHPWNAADHGIVPVDLRKYGYVEEEYLVSGVARVYGWGSNGEPRIETRDAPYTTRILIRRPSDPRRFSGTVWVNPYNPTMGVDIENLWACCHDYLLGHGDIHVGFTFKPVAARSLRVFDPQRYAHVSFANPLPVERRCKVSRPDDIEDQENGLAWDLFSDIAALLRDGSSRNPLAKYLQGKRVKLYAFGYSQDAAYLRTYVNNFHARAEAEVGAPPFDGYVIAAGGNQVALNQCIEARPSDPATGGSPIRPRDVPVITYNTEADYRAVFDGQSSLKARRPDGDAPNDRYRHYELPGAIHLGSYFFMYGPAVADVTRVREVAPMAFGTFSQEARRVSSGAPITDLPQQYVLDALLDNLDRWVRHGVAPPPGAWISTTAAGDTVVDEYGNARGGVRTPQVDVPTGTFFFGKPEGPINWASYEWRPFDRERLRRLYPTHGEYVRKSAAVAATAVKSRYLLPPAAQALEAAARQADVP